MDWKADTAFLQFDLAIGRRSSTAAGNYSQVAADKVGAKLTEILFTPIS